MDWYSVRVEARGVPAAAVPQDALDQLMDSIADHSGSVGASDRGWDATVSLEAGDPVEATQHGRDLLVELAAKAGMPPFWPVVRVEAVLDEVLAEELERPNLPQLVSGAEAAVMLKVSRQRVHQLAYQHSKFPKPLYQLGVGSLWARAAVERFAETWERKPGRPRAAVELVAKSSLTVGGPPPEDDAVSAPAPEHSEAPPPAVADGALCGVEQP